MKCNEISFLLLKGLLFHLFTCPLQEVKRSSKITVIENGYHACVCSLFQVIKHISTGLYVVKVNIYVFTHKKE